MMRSVLRSVETWNYREANFIRSTNMLGRHMLLFPPLLLLFTSSVRSDANLLSTSCPPQLDASTFTCQYRRLTAIPTIIHRDTRVLDLSNNRLAVLHEDSFLYLGSLERLTLTGNRLVKITERALVPLADSLMYLSLRRNQLRPADPKSLPSSTLRPLRRLVRLDLAENPIDLLPTGWFDNFEGPLVELHLDESYGHAGMHLEPKAFQGLGALRQLNLGHVRLSTPLSKEAFAGLPISQMTELRLNGVRWKACDCQLDWLPDWLIQRPGYNESSLEYERGAAGICESPKHLAGMSVLQLNITHFQCPIRLLGLAYQYTDEPTVVQHNGFAVSIPCRLGKQLRLICRITGQTKPQVTWHRNGMPLRPEEAEADLDVQIGHGEAINFTLTFGVSACNHGSNTSFHCRASAQSGEEINGEFRFNLPIEATTRGNVQTPNELGDMIYGEAYSSKNRLQIVKMDSRLTYSRLSLFETYAIWMGAIVVGTFICTCTFMYAASRLLPFNASKICAFMNVGALEVSRSSPTVTEGTVANDVLTKKYAVPIHKCCAIKENEILLNQSHQEDSYCAQEVKKSSPLITPHTQLINNSTGQTSYPSHQPWLFESTRNTLLPSKSSLTEAECCQFSTVHLNSPAKETLVASRLGFPWGFKNDPLQEIAIKEALIPMLPINGSMMSFHLPREEKLIYNFSLEKTKEFCPILKYHADIDEMDAERPKNQIIPVISEKASLSYTNR
ncbi:unnamed protein product [Protopolystoma xenopodis]|uniref:Ig-like domain-containing protein n=1 Tax=Protopolystoma xenopodis TaxID=117903 RepID=A0A448WUV1_9PLAT|nr:unnamed protein product [Protopolystoma xenopodis]